MPLLGVPPDEVVFGGVFSLVGGSLVLEGTVLGACGTPSGTPGSPIEPERGWG